MRDRAPTQIHPLTLIPAVLIPAAIISGAIVWAALLWAAATGLPFGTAVTPAGAEDLHLQPGTDCSRLLETEQEECVRTMRRLQLRQAEQNGEIMPDSNGGDSNGGELVIQRGTVPSLSTNPFHVVPHAGSSGGVSMRGHMSGGMNGM